MRIDAIMDDDTIGNVLGARPGNPTDQNRGVNRESYPPTGETGGISLPIRAVSLIDIIELNSGCDNVNTPKREVQPLHFAL